MRLAALVLAVVLAVVPGHSFAACSAFTASSMEEGVGDKAGWRFDYPPEVPRPATQPWSSIDFQARPADYMKAVLDTARPSFHADGRRIVGAPDAKWWVSEWLDYTTSGRERLMGLTKERGPDEGDLSPTSGGSWQVWAVGFYNGPGAAILGQVFAEPCNPSFPVSLKFPRDTVSIKFLFTDAPSTEVPYLKDAPEYDAFIDPEGSTAQVLPKDRVKRAVRLLQVDISVKDQRARDTGWVFGTFGWVGPPQGDGLFDNLVPVSLQWGNDPAVYDTNLKQSWINPALAGKMFGWSARPFLGFNGRANGPADNIRSSCLSCHAAARTPRADIGILNNGFRMPQDLLDAGKTKAHVDAWFQNVLGGNLFRPETPAAAALDYSLQLEAAAFRICRACDAGDLTGATPDICRQAGFFNRPMCTPDVAPLSTSTITRKTILQSVPPPRQ